MHGCNFGKTRNGNVNEDSSTHYDVLENIYASEMFKNPDTMVDTVSLEWCGKDYKKLTADLA